MRHGKLCVIIISTIYRWWTEVCASWVLWLLQTSPRQRRQHRKDVVREFRSEQRDRSKKELAQHNDDFLSIIIFALEMRNSREETAKIAGCHLRDGLFAASVHKSVYGNAEIPLPSCARSQDEPPWLRSHFGAGWLLKISHTNLNFLLNWEFLVNEGSDGMALVRQLLIDH